MRVEDHGRTHDISDDSSADDAADITVEVREEAYVDGEVDHEEDDEILHDAIVSDFFEQEDIGDEGRDDSSVEQMIDRCEIAHVGYIVDDENCYEDDVEKFEDLLGPSWHGSEEVVECFYGF